MPKNYKEINFLISKEELKDYVGVLIGTSYFTVFSNGDEKLHYEYEIENILPLKFSKNILILEIVLIGGIYIFGNYLYTGIVCSKNTVFIDKDDEEYINNEDFEFYRKIYENQKN